MLQIKRVYEPPDRSDGRRILVERLWPRGLAKEKAAVDLWLRDIAPSTELRRWFAHDPNKWEQFRKRYLAELREKGELIDQLRREIEAGNVTLVYAAHDEQHNSAVVLQELLEGRRRRPVKSGA